MWGSRAGIVTSGLLAAILAVAALALPGTPPEPAEQAGSTDPVSAPVLASGEDLFLRKGCAGCHGDLTGRGELGPDLRHLADVAPQRVAGLTAAEYVRQSIVDPVAFTVAGYPSGLMPRLQLTEEEVDRLVDYLLAGEVSG